ncbi:11511_t:CDS:2 [Ambispora leptoticha]|uniref:11511_t:CDS:1 n=1 Tax=Ambispora leptoticha TaxID=144679 RepID=A0A9N8YQB4_9GLOM|nr:11511_t:CDS:2 [Ambispora leptoticha]
MVLVPRTNTRGWGEYPQASEKTIVKELGKLAPSLLTRKRMYRGRRLPGAPRLKGGVAKLLVSTGEDAGYPQLDGKTPWSFTAT